MAKIVPYSLGMKIIGFISFLLGLSLLSVCFWTLVSLSENKKIAALQPQPLTAVSVYNQQNTLDNLNDTNIEAVLEKVRSTWNDFSPYFRGSCGGSLIVGILQLVVSMVILCSSSKRMARRATAWKIISIILSIALIICLTIPAAIDLSQKDGGIRNHLSELLKLFKSRHLMKIDEEDIQNLFIFYIALITDAVGLLILVLVNHYLVDRLKPQITQGKIL